MRSHTPALDFPQQRCDGDCDGADRNSAGDLIGVSPDAALLAVLVGASSDFLTPIGHQNNMLVMGPGGYRFTDYARAGGVLALLTVATAAGVLSLLFG